MNVFENVSEYYDALMDKGGGSVKVMSKFIKLCKNLATIGDLFT